jgi:hypothetical protein
MSETDTDDALTAPEPDEKFAGATKEELAAYVASSHIRPGEDADKWRQRVQDEERELLAKVKDRPKPDSSAWNDEEEKPF